MKHVGGLAASLASLQERLKQREQTESQEREANPPAPQQNKNNLVQLPLWPDAVRAVPNSFLRSALFGAIRKGRRRYLDGEQIAAVDGIEVRYTGQRLDQGDLDVWEALLHAVREQDLGSECRVTSYALLKLMGKADTGGNRQTLHKRITRLCAGAIEVKNGRYVYIGGLVGEAFKDEKTHAWLVVVNPKLRALYGPNQFTQIEWAVRHELDGQQLAQWLHGFYASHAKPFPIKVETLLQLAGSENEATRSAYQKLRKALDALAKASTAKGAPFSYEIREGLVHVEKAGSRAQRRHLARKR